MLDDFDFENAWILSGHLTTPHIDRIVTALHARFPVAPHDPERECRLTVDAQTHTLSVFLRHDGVIGSLDRDLLQLAPEAQGVLRFESPYTELQEALFPQDWRFDGAGHLAIFGYHLAPDVTAQATYNATVR